MKKGKLLSLLVTVMLIFSSIPMMPASAAPEIWDGKTNLKLVAKDGSTEGGGTKDNPWLIRNGADLRGLVTLLYKATLKSWLDYDEVYSHDYFIITNDIYLNDISDYDSWSLDKAPKNKWKDHFGGCALNGGGGVIDGQGHTIYGLYAVAKEEKFGLLPNIWGSGIIKNVNIDKAKVYCMSHSGILCCGVGAGGSIINCHVSGEIICYGGQKVGGIVGQLSGSKIEDCIFNGNVGYIGSKASAMGGIVGTVTRGGGYTNPNTKSNEIINCIHYGNVEGTGSCGGLVGSFDARGSDLKITDCLNIGNVTVAADNAVGGGFIGASYMGGQDDSTEPDKHAATLTVSNCVNVGDVKAKGKDAKLGAFIGRTDAPKSFKLSYSLSNLYYDSSVCKLAAIGVDGASQMSKITGLATAQISGTGAVSRMKLGSAWQDISNYYPVIKTLHANKWTVIGNLSTSGGSSSSSSSGSSGGSSNSGSGSSGSSGGSGNSSGSSSGVSSGDSSDTQSGTASDGEEPLDSSVISDSSSDSESDVTVSGSDKTEVNKGGTDKAESGKSNAVLFIVLGAVVILLGAAALVIFVILPKKGIYLLKKKS